MHLFVESLISLIISYTMCSFQIRLKWDDNLLLVFVLFQTVWPSSSWTPCPTCCTPLLLTTPPNTCIAAAFVQARQTQVISTHFTFIIYLQFSAKRCHEASKVVAKGSSEGVLSVEGCHLGFTVTKRAVSRMGPKLPPSVLGDTACCGKVSLSSRLTFSFTQAMFITHTNYEK